MLVWSDKMKTIKGRYPTENRREQIGNSDCKLNSNGKSIIEIVGDYVHAVRVEDEVACLQRDIMYLAPSVTLPRFSVIGEVSTHFDIHAPGAYEAMIQHIEVDYKDCCKEFFELNSIRFNENSGRLVPAKKILLNSKLIGYYLPELNSWLLGNWTWHDHYITVLLRHIWPQIVHQLTLGHCENSINGGTKQAKKKITISMGADPELEVKKNGRVVKADAALNIHNYTSTDIGLDGAASQLEFRPKPGTPQQVVKNIRHLVKKFSEKYPEFDLTDEGNRYPLGGHIHAGVGHPIDCPNDLVAILDDFIGKPTLKLSGKARGSYQYLSMVRSQPHGFEYRSTPSAVFQNPVITHIVLSLMKNLCEKYFNQETLIYNDNPTEEDYVKVGGLKPRQVKYFMEFCRSYKPEKSIRSSWKVEPVPESSVIETHAPAINFRDEWDPVVAGHLTEDIQEGVQTSLPITVTLYGLSRERGENMATIQIVDTCLIDGSLPRPHWGRNTLNIGFSRELRTRGMGRTRRMDIVRSIANLINEREQLEASQ